MVLPCELCGYLQAEEKSSQTARRLPEGVERMKLELWIMAISLFLSLRLFCLMFEALFGKKKHD